jgi:hypothetical protein
MAFIAALMLSSRVPNLPPSPSVKMISLIAVLALFLTLLQTDEIGVGFLHDSHSAEDFYNHTPRAHDRQQ